MIRVFLPAYNEEAALPVLVRKFDAELKRAGESYRILIVDDGSKDGTVQTARDLSKNFPIEILRHEKNLGLGQTVIDGLNHVARQASPEDLIVSMDCDDTHDPRYMSAAFQKIRQGYDLVILSRYQRGGGEEGLSPFRSFLSRCAASFLKVFFPIKGVWEYSCSYRVYRASALQRAMEVFGDRLITLPRMGFVAVPELLIKFRMLGLRVAEVPFRLQYGQKAGKSKMNFSKTISGYFALVLRFWGRGRPRCVRQ